MPILTRSKLLGLLSACVVLAADSLVRNTNTYGILKLQLHPGSYDWSFVPESGGTFTDSGSDTCR